MQIQALVYLMLGLMIGSAPISMYSYLRVADVESRMERETHILTNQVSSLQEQSSNLRDQLTALQEHLEGINKDYNSLKTKWNIWQKHKNLAPQPQDTIEVWGNVRKVGTHLINRTSVLVSFPEPDKCLMVLRTPGTGSMRPAFYGNHQILVNKCVVKSDIRLGDIIAFQSPQGKTIVHQIIDVDLDGVLTKGIYNEMPDPYTVKWEDIIGIVVAIIY